MTSVLKFAIYLEKGRKTAILHTNNFAPLQIGGHSLESLEDKAVLRTPLNNLGYWL